MCYFSFQQCPFFATMCWWSLIHHQHFCFSASLMSSSKAIEACVSLSSAVLASKVTKIILGNTFVTEQLIERTKNCSSFDKSHHSATILTSQVDDARISVLSIIIISINVWCNKTPTKGSKKNTSVFALIFIASDVTKPPKYCKSQCTAVVQIIP